MQYRHISSIYFVRMTYFSILQSLQLSCYNKIYQNKYILKIVKYR